MTNNVQIAKSDLDLIVAVLRDIDTDNLSYDERRELEKLLQRMESKQYSLLARKAYAKMQSARAENNPEEEKSAKMEYLKYKGLAM